MVEVQLHCSAIDAASLGLAEYSRRVLTLPVHIMLPVLRWKRSCILFLKLKLRALDLQTWQPQSDSLPALMRQLMRGAKRTVEQGHARRLDARGVLAQARRLSALAYDLNPSITTDLLACHYGHQCSWAFRYN